MPEISIIVPVYKVEKYLDRCVRSILNQTFRDFECILVDDGSPDRSGAMCDEWAKRDARIRVVHKENGGASSARNSGLDVAEGRYIAFIDSDDWVHKEMLAILYRLIVREKVRMAFGRMKIVNRENFLHKENKKINYKIMTKKDLLDRFFRIHGEPSVYGIWGGLYTADFFEKYRFIEGRMNEDIETWYQLCKYCDRAVYTDFVLYYYYRNGNSVTNGQFTMKKEDLLYIWKLLDEDVKKTFPEYQYACEMNCKRAYFTLLCHMRLYGYDKSNEKIVELEKEYLEKVKKYKRELLRWKMPISRKVLLLLYVLELFIGDSVYVADEKKSD